MVFDSKRVLMGPLFTPLCALEHLHRAWRVVRRSLRQTAWPALRDELAEFDRSRDPQTIITVDDCEQLDERRQEALFHLFNRVLASPRLALVCAGAQPPAVLSLREDLRTRLGYGLVLRIRPLSDAERQLALEQWMREAGMRCSPELIEHLLRHRPRDLRSLITLLHALDRFGLERQRALTVPLLREFEAHAADTLNR